MHCFTLYSFSGARCVKVDEVDWSYQRQKDSYWSVQFTDVQLVHKFAG